MYTTMTSAADWERLDDLAAAQHVIQIGYGYGHDTARIARAAASVTCVDQALGLPHTGYASPIDQWHEILMFHHVRSKCFYLPRTWQLLHDELIPGSFGLAVIDLPALRNPDIGQVTEFGLFCAPVVAIFEGPLMRGMDIHEAARDNERQAIAYGNVHVLRPMPAPAGQAAA